MLFRSLAAQNPKNIKGLAKAIKAAEAAEEGDGPGDGDDLEYNRCRFIP